MKEIAILAAAKERLFEKGWKQRGFGPSEGPNCIAGAINQCRSSINETVHLYKTLEVISWELGFDGIVQLNDNKTTTFDDIVNVIDLTIKRLESE